MLKGVFDCFRRASPVVLKSRVFQQNICQVFLGKNLIVVHHGGAFGRGILAGFRIKVLNEDAP